MLVTRTQELPQDTKLLIRFDISMTVPDRPDYGFLEYQAS